jgi:hypothetical protein
MANKKVSQLVSKPSVLVTDLFPIADPTTGQLYKTTISDLGTAIGSGVSSVNTLVGAVVLDTDDIQELASPTNRWFTDTRARAALSASSPLAYNSGTGVFSIPQATGSQNGFLSSADWTTFNAKQTALNGTGFVKISGTTISYDNSTYALDSAVVKLTGTQSISGVKTFNSQPVFGNTLMLQNTASGTVLFGGYTTMWTTDSALTVLVGTASSTTIGFSLLYDSSAQRSYTMPTSNGTLALTSQLSAYLPLGGGTMTGVLFGASASFSGFVGFGGNTSPLAAVDVTGAGIFSSSVRSSGYYLTGMTSGSGALYYSSGANRVTVANYNASGIVTFEVNGGSTALTLNSNLSATFASTLSATGATLTGALSGTSATFSQPVGITTTGTTAAIQVTLPGNANATILSANSGNASFGWKLQMEEVSTGDFRIFRRESGVDYQVLNLARATGAATFSNNVTLGNTASSSNAIVTFQNNVNGFQFGFASNTTQRFTFINGGGSEIASISGAGAATFSSTVTLPNNTYLQFNNSSGTARTILTVDASNTTVLRHAASGGAFALQNFANTQNNLLITDAGAATFQSNVSVGEKLQVQSSLTSGQVNIGALLNSGVNGITIQTYQSPGGGNFILFVNNAGNAAGSITHSGTTTVLYNVTSDYRLKEDLKPIYGLDIVNKIKIYDYKWKSDNTRMDGVLAHELAEVLPYAVNGVKDGVEMQQVDYSKIVPVMIQAIKDLKAKIETLENK